MYQPNFLMNVISNQTSSVKQFFVQRFFFSKEANMKINSMTIAFFHLLFLSSSSLSFFPFLFLCLYGFRKYNAQKTLPFGPFSLK